MDKTEKKSSSVDKSDKKKRIDKAISAVTEFMQYYYVSIPLIVALMLIFTTDSLKNIPGLESSLFDPAFRIGLYFVIMSSIAGLALLFNSKLEMKKLRKEVDQIKKHLYTLENKEEIKKPKEPRSFSLIEKWNKFFGNPINDFQNWRKTKEVFTKERTYVYITIILISLSLIHIAGQNLAESVAPTAHSINYTSKNDPNYELDDFEIEYSVSNFDQPRFQLMKPTELLKTDIKIINNSPYDVELIFSDTTYVGGLYIKNNKITEPILIKQNKEHEFSRWLYLEDIGINTFYLNFEFEKYRENKGVYGSAKEYQERIVGETSVSFRTNVISQSDYDSKIQQYYVYYYLAVVASPLVLIGVRSLKEIIEDKTDS